MLKLYICIFNFVSHFLMEYLWILKFHYYVKYIHIIINTNEISNFNIVVVAIGETLSSFNFNLIEIRFKMYQYIYTL
jgi:hypothetical protein